MDARWLWTRLPVEQTRRGGSVTRPESAGAKSADHAAAKGNMICVVCGLRKIWLLFRVCRGWGEHEAVVALVSPPGQTGAGNQPSFSNSAYCFMKLGYWLH